MSLERQKECALDTGSSRIYKSGPENAAGNGAEIRVNIGSEEGKCLTKANCRG